MALDPIKNRNLWIITAVDHGPGRTRDWVLGGREAATFQRFYDQLTHLTNGSLYTDQWEAIAQALPKDRHSLGKAHTPAIARDHSHTRPHLARMTRRTKVVFTSTAMVQAS